MFSKHIGIYFGIAAGIAASVGVLAFFLAAKYGPALIPSIITPVLSATTASLLALFLLKEPFSLFKLIGLVLALSGLFIRDKSPENVTELGIR